MTQTGKKSINSQSISIKAVLNVSKNDLNGRKPMHLPILFPQPFSSTPVVSVGLTGLRTRQESISFDAEVENHTYWLRPCPRHRLRERLHHAHIPMARHRRITAVMRYA